MALLADFVVQNANSPGTSTSVVMTTAAHPSLRTFSNAFTSGSQVYYTISDELTMRETGIGTFTAPNTISRDTVLANTIGTTARMNFIGPCLVYNEVPATRQLFLDAAGGVASFSNLAVTGTLTAGNVTTGGALTAVTINTTGTINNNGSGQILQVGTGWTNRMRSDGAGSNALHLLQSPTGTAASGLVISVRAPTSPFCFWQHGVTTVGSITTNGTTTLYNQTSDRRLKLTFGPAEVGDIIDSVPVYDAAFIAKPQDHQPLMLADELEKVCPWAVTGEAGAVNPLGQPIYQEVSYSSLVPTLWAEIQSLRRRIAEQERALASLQESVGRGS